MNDDDLIQQLGRAATPVVRSPDCLDEYRLAAAAADQRITSAERTHLADCRYCRARLSDLAHIQASSLTPQPAPALMEHAARLGDRKPRWRSAPRWAVAAALVLAVGVTAERMHRVAPPAATTPTAADTRQVRNLDPDALRPAILAPAQGGQLPGLGPQFEWTALPGALYYDIRIVDLGGDLVGEARVSDNQWRLPADLELEPGAEYYVRVDAYLAEARRVSSRHTLFIAGEDR